MRYGIVGGDKRQLYLAKAIARDGAEVYLHGLEELNTAPFIQMSLRELAGLCDIIIFPLPATKDGLCLNAPFTKERILLNDDFAACFSGKKVFGGMMNRLYQTSLYWEKISCVDYYLDEALTIGNALLTAEAAIAAAINESDGSLCGAEVLVTGFGRIGKLLCMLLKGFHAKVDCCARKKRDLAGIQAVGCNPLFYQEIQRRYDYVFNTVPARVLGASVLSQQDQETLLIELASQPGGIDLDAASGRGLKVVSAQSLPGRVSPKASGELIKETIFRTLALDEVGT